MAYDTLVSDDIRRGRDVLDAVQAAGTVLQGAFWRHDADEERWRLVLISQEASEGVRPLMLKAAHVLDFDDLQQLEFRPPSDILFQAVERAGGKASDEGKRVRSLIVAGRYIDDAFLYAL